MRKDMLAEIEIPDGADAEIKEGYLILRKGDEELKRKLNSLVKVGIKGNKIVIEAKKSTRKERKIFGTLNAHIKNMIRGLGEKFKYKMQICAVHFPMTASFNKEKNELVVKNFLGEKYDRIIKLSPKVDIKVNKDIIEIECSDKETAGLAASSIEKGTTVSRKDRRVFQDGIFIIEKPGRSYL